jgi:ketosteroid isomerase-like protein
VREEVNSNLFSRLGALLLVLAATTSFAQEQPLPSIDLPAGVARVLRDYETAWRGRDAAALAKLFTEDGFVLASGRQPVRGRAAVEAAYKGAGGPLFLRAMAWSADGDTGYIIGGYRGRSEGPDEGKFILAIRRVDGRWLIAADIDNSNSPPKPRPTP